MVNDAVVHQQQGDSGAARRSGNSDRSPGQDFVTLLKDHSSSTLSPTRSATVKEAPSNGTLEFGQPDYGRFSQANQESIRSQTLVAALQTGDGQNGRQVQDGRDGGAADQRPPQWWDTTRPGQVHRNEAGQIMGARYNDGSGVAVRRDEQGRITGASMYDAQGRVTRQFQGSDTSRLDIKDDGSLEHSLYNKKELPGNPIYDRTGKQIGQSSSTVFDRLSTETIRPDGTKVIEDKKAGTVTEVGKDKIKQTYPDHSSREVKMDAAGQVNQTTFT